MSKKIKLTNDFLQKLSKRKRKVIRRKKYEIIVSSGLISKKTTKDNSSGRIKSKFNNITEKEYNRNYYLKNKDKILAKAKLRNSKKVRKPKEKKIIKIKRDIDKKRVIEELKRYKENFEISDRTFKHFIKKLKLPKKDRGTNRKIYQQIRKSALRNYKRANADMIDYLNKGGSFLADGTSIAGSTDLIRYGEWILNNIYGNNVEEMINDVYEISSRVRIRKK